MGSELRKVFDAQLALQLKTLTSSVLDLRAKKRSLAIHLPSDRKKVGELFFEFLRNADGVYVGCEVFDDPVSVVVSEMDAPPKSFLLNASTMSFNSLWERHHEFSGEVGGVVRLFSAMDVEQVCGEIVRKVAAYHLKKVERLLSLDRSLVSDIREYPDHYARPLLMAAMAWIANGESDWRRQYDALRQEPQLKKFDQRFDLDSLEATVEKLVRRQ